MHIHFDNVNFSSRSGPNTFASRLATILTERGHEIVSYAEHHDAVLVFIEPTRQWKRGARTVQRLDGIWFKPDQFYSHNKLIKWAYDNSNAIVWQSVFDRDMTVHHWGLKEGSVIRNGIDADQVQVKNQKLKQIRRDHEKVFVCSANWHRQKRLKENIEAYDIISRNYSNSCMIVMGSNPDYVVDRPDVIYTGNISHELCLQAYSLSDAMIHLAWLDHCPNVVVEAISQNCPVICSSSGGTKEIVGTGGYILNESRQYKFELADYDDPYTVDLTPLKEINIEDLAVDNSNISLEKTADEYEKVLSGDENIFISA